MDVYESSSLKWEINRTGQQFEFFEFIRVISEGRSTWIDFFSEDDEFSMVEVFGFSKKTLGSCHESSTWIFK